MRTLALLAALLLLAFQAQAQTVQETTDQVPIQDQPGEDQDQPGDEDQDMAISFTGEEHFAPEAAGFQRKLCTCQTGPFCRSSESYVGSCKLFGAKGRLCCR